MSSFALQLHCMKGLKNLSVRLSEDQRIQLGLLAKRHDLKESYLIRKAVDAFLADYVKRGPLSVGLPSIPEPHGSMLSAVPQPEAKVALAEALLVTQKRSRKTSAG